MSAYADVTFFKGIISIMLHYLDAALPPEARNSFESGCKELERFQDFVERLGSRNRKRMSAPLGRIMEAAQETRDMVETPPEDGDFIEYTYSIIDMVKKQQEECYSLLEEDEEEEEEISSKMIGLRDQRRKVKETLVCHFLATQPVYLLTGMAGVGKTTLAREIFEDRDISEHFEYRAWVTLGNQWKSKEITEAILGQIDPEAHKAVLGGDEEEISQRLKECLKLGKRYLIVVDDVWDHSAFRDYMERLLLHDLKGSQVMLITRIKDSKYDDPRRIVKLRLLNEEESWDLLREKAFPGGSCPPQLVDVGKMIAKKCDGLPLTIITVADLLSKAEESLWIDVATKRKHQIFTYAYDQISKVLYPSYKELRDELKLCFLYMGVFPLKNKIHRSKLFNLWKAEELFDQFEGGDSPHATFLRSIMHLDDCSLVMVHQRSTTYSLLNRSCQAIRTCGLHSSWWHFCQREASKSGFFYVLDCYKDGIEEGIKSQTRLSVHNNVLFALKDVYNSMEENCASTVQSLLCFGPYNQYMVPMCFGLKLLQRLDALNIRFYDFPLEVLELAKLIYLALTCNRQLPSSISKLEKLQYLIVHPHLSITSSASPTYMPMEIWDLEELKYLHVLGSDLPDPGDRSLEMLSTLLDVSTASCTVLNKLPNLEKLRIRIVLTPEAPDPLCSFDHISNMMKVEALTCVIVNPGFKFEVAPPVASFPILPHALKKLSLSGLGYPWEKMREIASLKGLQVLKLKFNAFHGQIWEVEEMDFPDLRFLLMEDLDLVKLKRERGSFEYIHHVSINHCYKLEEIQLGDTKNITRIVLVDSNPLVEKYIKGVILDEFILETRSEYPQHLSVHCSWKSASGSKGMHYEDVDFCQ